MMVSFASATVTLAILLVSFAYAYVPSSLPAPLSTSARPASLRSFSGGRQQLVASSSLVHKVGSTCRPPMCAFSDNTVAAKSMSSLYLSPNGDENNDANDAVPKEDDKSTATKNPIGQVLDVAFTFSSFVIQFLGVAFSLGLLLNICGYGYTFDLERGVHIDKMENIRTELQFRREVQRSN